MDFHNKTWPPWLKSLSSNLTARGLDIMHPFQVQVFNQESPPDNKLPDFGRIATLGILIGNSCQLWPHFIAALASSPTAIQSDNPLDQYVESAVHGIMEAMSAGQALDHSSRHTASTAAPTTSAQHLQNDSCQDSLTPGCHTSLVGTPEQDRAAACFAYEVRFSHSVGDKFVNMLRVAQLSGLAYYSSTTHLCMHPVYGPWFALRAVVICDLPWPGKAKRTASVCSASIFVA
jgi:hypothetical protein